MVKNLPAIQETEVQSLGWKDPLEKGLPTHSSLAQRIPWTEEPSRVTESNMTNTFTLHKEDFFVNMT